MGYNDENTEWFMGRKTTSDTGYNMKKMIIVSPETHSSLFLVKGSMQKNEGKNITFNEVMKKLISYYNKPENPIPYFFKLEEKE